MKFRMFTLVCFGLLFFQASSQKNEPYTKFIENNTKINWAAEYRSIVNLAPITNTISLKKYYLDRIRKQGVRSYIIDNRMIKDSTIVRNASLQTPEWLKDHYVYVSPNGQLWEFRSRKNSPPYRVTGFTEDSCCGCDGADAFMVDQLVIYSAGKFATRNIFLSPLCVRQAGESNAAWFPLGTFAWNLSASKPSGSTFITTSNVTYKIDPYDSSYTLDLLTLGDNRLMNHLLKDIQSGKVTAHDPDTDKRIGYSDLLTWNMPYDTVVVYDLDMNVTHQVVQQVLDASDFRSIRLEQDWYFDFKTQRLFSEVRSALLLVDVLAPNGELRGVRPFVRLRFKG